MKENLVNSVHEKLYHEYVEFIQKIEKLPPKQIIDNAYSISVKQELVDMFYGSSRFSNRELKALLELPHTLDYLYDSWLDADGGIHEVIFDGIENDLTTLAEEYSDKLLSNVEKNKHFNLYSDISDICVNLDYYGVCDELKAKYNLEELDEIDIDVLFKSKDGKKYLYKFLNDLPTNEKICHLSETNVMVYKSVDTLKNKILPQLKEIIDKDNEKSKKEHER